MPGDEMMSSYQENSASQSEDVAVCRAGVAPPLCVLARTGSSRVGRGSQGERESFPDLYCVSWMCAQEATCYPRHLGIAVL